jgi:hypothetical protein
LLIRHSSAIMAAISRSVKISLQIITNPCKVIRSITEDDKRLLFHNEEIDDEAWADITSRMSF